MSNNVFAFFDGKVVPEERAKVSIKTHALNYGFRTMVSTASVIVPVSDSADHLSSRVSPSTIIALVGDST
ncbi:MAG: hypothetical protein KAT85_01195, partial [candidate division Zixibacteria bacterium]|nr:hypothetical protein [candidate division Zixibacteria bacterium]